MCSKGIVVCISEGGCIDAGILPCVQLEHTGKLEGTSKSLEKPLMQLGALIKTSLDGCLRCLCISSRVAAV
jgi:hypothetical protein